MDAFLVWLLHEAGLDPALYRGRCFMRRLSACLRQLRAATPAEARRLLEARPELLPVALDSVLLGVTQFFRDTSVFDAVRSQVLPELLATGQPVRIWSAACSDGPELYSVAMLVADADGLSRCELLGTDCRPTAIQRAAAGLYATDALRFVHATHRKYFSDGGPLVRIVPELRQAIRWQVHDLFTAPARGPWDLILWRNMSIYLEAAAGESLWRALDGELRPGGFLIAGKADHPPRELGWSRVAPCVYRKSTYSP